MKVSCSPGNAVCRPHLNTISQGPRAEAACQVPGNIRTYVQCVDHLQVLVAIVIGSHRDGGVGPDWRPHSYPLGGCSLGLLPAQGIVSKWRFPPKRLTPAISTSLLSSVGLLSLYLSLIHTKQI